MRGVGKGNTNNKDGRPLGSKNEKTKQWEKLGEFITESGAQRVMEHLNSIKDDATFFAMYEKLLNYFKPKMQSTQLETKGDPITSITVKIIDNNSGHSETP